MTNKSRSPQRGKSVARFFPSERALVLSYLRTIPRTANTLRIVHTELESANGTADIVRVTLRRDWRRWGRLGKIQPQWAYALKALPYRRNFSTKYFAHLAGVTEKTARLVLKSYTKCGFCEPRYSQWVKIKQPLPLATEIIAIEAKLSDWKRALAQAYRYQDYATKTWVLLDAKHAKPAISNVGEFKRLNVGLVILAPGKTPRIISRPTKRAVRSPVRHWHALSSIGRLAL